jgi:hypothetical protein
MYDGALIFSTEFDFAHKGFYGFKDNILVFYPFESLDDSIKIDIPEDMQEMEMFIKAADYIGIRLTTTPIIEIMNLGETTFESAIKPFVNFLSLYEKRHQKIQEIKYGCC